MARDGLLHLDRRDVLAAGDDDVLRAIAELHVAVRVTDGEITRVKPPAPERIRRRVVGLGSSPSSRCSRASPPRRAPTPSRGNVGHAPGRPPGPRRRSVRDALPRASRCACSAAIEPLPARLPLADGVRPVGLGQPVDVHGSEVQLSHLREQRRRRRRARHGDRHLVLEPVRASRGSRGRSAPSAPRSGA